MSTSKICIEFSLQLIMYVVVMVLRLTMAMARPHPQVKDVVDAATQIPIDLFQAKKTGII